MCPQGSRLLPPCAVAFLASMFLVGYAPYGRNVVEHQSPFYPVVTSSGLNPRIVSNNWPPNIADLNRVSRFVAVNFAYANGDYPPPEARPKFPFWTNTSELTAWRVGDTRIGGLGPLYAGMLLVSAGLLVTWIALRPRDPGAQLCAACVCVLVASIFIHSEGWWARYAPQAWLVPLTILIMAAGSSLPAVRTMAGVLVVLSCLNVGLLSGGIVYSQYRYRTDMRATLTDMAAAAPVHVYMFRFMSLRQRLLEAGIPFQTEEERPGESVVTHAIPSADPADSFWWK